LRLTNEFGRRPGNQRYHAVCGGSGDETIGHVRRSFRARAVFLPAPAQIRKSAVKMAIFPLVLREEAA
jgi:hypothetical protein